MAMDMERGFTVLPSGKGLNGKSDLFLDEGNQRSF